MQYLQLNQDHKHFMTWLNTHAIDRFHPPDLNAAWKASKQLKYMPEISCISVLLVDVFLVDIHEAYLTKYDA